MFTKRGSLDKHAAFKSCVRLAHAEILFVAQCAVIVTVMLAQLDTKRNLITTRFFLRGGGGGRVVGFGFGAFIFVFVENTNPSNHAGMLHSHVVEGDDAHCVADFEFLLTSLCFAWFSCGRRGGGGGRFSRLSLRRRDFIRRRRLLSVIL